MQRYHFLSVHNKLLCKQNPMTFCFITLHLNRTSTVSWLYNWNNIITFSTQHFSLENLISFFFTWKLGRNLVARSSRSRLERLGNHTICYLESLGKEKSLVKSCLESLLFDGSDHGCPKSKVKWASWLKLSVFKIARKQGVYKLREDMVCQ